MFNPLRLLRGRDHIDDSSMAYVEGRATDEERARVEIRMAADPAFARDLESLRQTVTLLRSVASVAAPRSFALSEAPVRPRASRPRLVMAPAAMAIVAAVGVALLAAGNISDVVRQSGGGVDAASRAGVALEAAPAVATTLAPGLAGVVATSAIVTAAGSSGERGREPEATNVVEEKSDGVTEALSAQAPAFGVEAAAQGTATPAPFATVVPLRAVPPPAAEVTVESATADDKDASISGPVGTAGTAGEASAARDGAPAPEAAEVQPQDAATLAAEPADGELAVVDVLDGTAGDEDGGLPLPLWQLQLALAALAAAMAGLWAFMRHRAAAGL